MILFVHLPSVSSSPSTHTAVSIARATRGCPYPFEVLPTAPKGTHPPPGVSQAIHPERADAEQREIEAKFWKALRSDMTIMLGLDGVEDVMRDMTAQIAATRTGAALCVHVEGQQVLDLLDLNDRAIATFVSKATTYGRDPRIACRSIPTQRDDRSAVEPLCRGLVRSAARRSQAGVAASRHGKGGNLARWIESSSPA